MEVTSEPATVYRAAGRRWLTLDGACRAAAREVVGKSDDAYDFDESWYMPRVKKLAGMYKARFKRIELGVAVKSFNSKPSEVE